MVCKRTAMKVSNPMKNPKILQPNFRLADKF